VTGFTGDSLVLIGVDGGIVAGSMAVQTVKIIADLVPILLKDGRGERIGVASLLPQLVEFFMADAASIRAGVIATPL
jgi:hypothetical protein